MSVEKFTRLRKTIDSRMSVNSSYANACLTNLRPSLVWTAKQMDTELSAPYGILLKGCYGAAVEAVALIAFALVRPAMASLRSHYEMNLQYLYYKDHPVEWRNVREFRSQPHLPGTVNRYMRSCFPKFEMRFKTLSQRRERSIEDSYQVLSGIAHGGAIESISSATKPEDLLESEAVVCRSISIFRDVGEHLSDIYVSGFEYNWLSLPDIIKKQLEQRFEGKNPRVELEL